MLEWIQSHDTAMLEWIRSHDTLLWWLVLLSAVTFVTSLVAVPWLVVRIPADYFAHQTRHPAPWADRHPVVRGLMLTGKNLLGCLLVLVGLPMLPLPGQGMLTILVGVMLLDFPGKYRLERWVIARGPILRSINWLRRRAAHPPLVVDG